MDLLRCPKCGKSIYAHDVKGCIGLGVFSEILQNRLFYDMKKNPEKHNNVFVCPNCGSAKHTGGMTGPIIYGVCAKGYCHRCRVKDRMHLHKTCEEYKEFLENNGIITKLFRGAEEFARENWSADVSPMTGFFPNRSLEQGCECLRRFAKTTFVEKIDDVLSESVFAWHGTSLGLWPPFVSKGLIQVGEVSKSMVKGSILHQPSA